MSRLADIIDLIQTTNEVYFITAPGRVRTAFILVDDIIELALKTFLQEKALEQCEQCIQAFEQAGWVGNDRQKNALHRYFREESDENEVCVALGRNPANNPNAITDFQSLITPFPLIQHWSANKPDVRNRFDSVIDEVKPFFPPLPNGSPHPAIALLDDALHRHRLRNKFYHDHQQSGLTIDDDKCLRALCGMFDLMEHLFPGTSTSDSFEYLVRQNKIVRCQIIALRIKASASGSPVLENLYLNTLEEIWKSYKKSDPYTSRNQEHYILHIDSDRVLYGLREKVRAEIAMLEIARQEQQAKIDSYQQEKTKAKHRPALRDIEHRLDAMNMHLREINNLLQE